MPNSHLTLQRGQRRTFALDSIPILSFDHFQAFLKTGLAGENFPLAYFAHPRGSKLQYIMVIASGETLFLSSFMADKGEPQSSLSATYASLQFFEREITHSHSVTFIGHPWPKPVRGQTDSYPFERVTNPAYHLVNVGPVHAGVIEPGVFRFICHGEKVINLECALGYQHRGVEPLIVSSKNNLRRLCLAEQVAAGSTIGHSLAMALLLEQGAAVQDELTLERMVALEMERMAGHLGCVAALSGDVAYQLGLVACQALRTVVINTMQLWCGNRFGRTLIRPFGSFYPLGQELMERVQENLGDVNSRMLSVSHNLLNMPTLLSRLEEVCTISPREVLLLGGVGVVARSTAIGRDSRQGLSNLSIKDFTPVVFEQGDMVSRLKVRLMEIRQSYKFIQGALQELRAKGGSRPRSAMDYGRALEPDSMTFSLVEGVVGPICHLALTDGHGELEQYKVYDPSLHNWPLLALSMRGGQISDFPLSNKSFELSYSGTDL
ncbi:MAG: NADH dehydrogenase subunit [Mucinivorans sp.]